MSGRGPLVAVAAALVIILVAWAFWPGDIDEDQTNNVSPAAADQEIMATPERVEPAEAPPDGEAPVTE